MKIFLALLMIASWTYAQTAPLFGTVTNVADDDMLNVRAQPNYKSRKISQLPPNAYIGIEKCKQIGKSRWCKIFQLVQNTYTENFHSGWVNARFLKLGNKGYVLIKGKNDNCYYSIGCNGDKCDIVVDANYDHQGNILKIYKKRIFRSLLRGESRFGAADKSSDGGYCVFDHRYSEFKKHLNATKRYKKISTDELSISYPSNLKSKMNPDESITLYLITPLHYISGSDMRDNPPILDRYTIFTLTLDIQPDTASAVRASGCKPAMYQSGKYFGFSGKKCEIGAEGAGVEYYVLNKNGKTLLLEHPYDHNQPLDPKTNQPIKGKWKLQNESNIIRDIIEGLSIKYP